MISVVLLFEADKYKGVIEEFNKAHHERISTIFITQNLFLDRNLVVIYPYAVVTISTFSHAI